MNWIPVSERLPEVRQYVLVADADKCVWTAQREFGLWIEDSSGAELADITHWMPMPEAPK